MSDDDDNSNDYDIDPETGMFWSSFYIWYLTFKLKLSNKIMDLD
jgi:hypothetical protein